MRRSVAALALAVVLPAGALLAPAARADVIVKQGETLSEIAERNGVSLTRLMQANGIKDPTLLQAGQRLVIPGAARPTAARTASTGGGSVTVRSGETLSEIAERNGVSLERLMQANGIKDPTLLQAGQRLVIPGARRAPVASPAPTPTGFYTVKSGETLSEIADRNGTSVDRLMQLNGISNPNLVVAGTRLSVPMRARPALAKAGNAKVHVVQPGETLSHIADNYNLPVEKLSSLNRISDPNLVVAGTRLQLQPPPPVAKPKPKLVASKPKPKPAATPVVASKPALKPAPKLAVTTAPTTSTAVAAATSGSEAQAAASGPAVAATSSTTATTAPAAAQPKPEPKPATPAVTASSATSPTPAAATATTTPATASPTTSTTPSKTATTATAVATAQPATPAVKPRPTTATANKPAAVARKPVGPDWRTYGPMQVDWANWRAMGGSFVAPSLGRDGKPHYLAINCGARKLNATSQSGQWRTWDSPQNDYEQRLVSDLCTTKGG
ncbi:MAG: LysM peptidoglycan-binding domain-containing protein [Cyanobacteria bacterium M_surface_7_m2_040]|nr:LysM peptidoglycan-binding domain-containing protein [Cyanobacteria bacterium K_Offshore_0m_m2_072]MBM5826858.1 LysM peptidoglycan-binding domain-containing protein [Cyanobacteria bacterium M_surface_7_m2_040]